MLRRLWVACGGTDSRVTESAAPRPIGSQWDRLDDVYDKELRLLHYVLQNAEPGCAESICHTVEEFANHHLVPQGHWLKVAGGEKAVALTRWVQQAPRTGDVLEVGTYMGFSAINFASALPGVRIISLEVDPVHAIIARTLVAFAGLAHCIDIWVGHSEDVLAQLRGCYGATGAAQQVPMFRAVFFDQRGSRYDRDLRDLEELHLLLPGCVVIADNC